MTANYILKTCSTLCIAVGMLAACSSSDDTGQGGAAPGTGGGGYNPTIDPASFVGGIDNEFLPMVPGTVMTYAENDDGELLDIVVTVTSETKTIMGVSCVVVHDLVTLAAVGGAGGAGGASGGAGGTGGSDGASGGAGSGAEVVEDTYDWYAQDVDGNVWYFGEDTTNYEEATPSHEGSWEAGVDGALPGIVMQANPQPGEPYRQEYLAGEAEDMARVLAVGQSVTVPAGSYSGCVQTEDYTPLDPGVVENKWYCPAVGMVRAEIVEGGSGEEELLSVTGP